MNISIREAGIDDAKMISDLAVRTFYESYAWYNTPENMKAYTETHFNQKTTEEELQQENTLFFVASVDNKTVGYAKLRNVEFPPELKNVRHIEIERIYVELAWQKHKVGYALIKKCIEKASEKNLDTIWLGVWERNTKAIAFYERAGFGKFGSHNFQFGDDLQVDHLFKYDLK